MLFLNTKNMSWELVQRFQTIELPAPADIIELERAFDCILKKLGSNKCHREAGYSTRFPRYQTIVSNDDNHHQLRDELTKHYWKRHRQLNELNINIKKREESIQTSCTHEWVKDYGSRDERSRYDCVKCGKYR